MVVNLFSKTAVCLSIISLLSACVGGGGGGSTVQATAPGTTQPPAGTTGGTGSTGGTTTPTPSAFQTNFDRVSATGPTADMPTSLQGTYAGKMRADVTGATAIVGQVEADVNLGVNWTNGQTANPFTGGASNFVGTLTGGTPQALTGSLSVGNTAGSGIQRVTVPGGTFAGVNVPASNSGAMQVVMSGQLSDSSGSATTTLTLGGNFFGPGASSAVGAVSGGFSNTANPGPSIFDGGVAGTFYLERQ